MSGHSKWHNIQKTKGAADAKRSQIFTKIAREMIVAVKTGGSGDPANNSRLAAVIAKAKAANIFDSNSVLPEYSYWKNVRNFCFSLIKGKRTPLAFQFVFSLAPKNIETLLLQNDLSVQADAVQGLYLNIRYNGETLTCITGTSFKTFTMDKTLEHAWDEMTENFFKKKGIDFELLN